MRYYLLLLCCIPTFACAQLISAFQNFAIQLDTATYDLEHHSIEVNGYQYLFFYFDEVRPTVELRLYGARKIDQLQLRPSGDFKIVDSLLWFDEGYYSGKVSFNDLQNISLLSFRFTAVTKGDTANFEVPMLPYTNTSVQFKPPNEELFIGEEKVFELTSKAPWNVYMDNQWVEDDSIDYLISKKNGELRLHIIPKKLGVLQLKIPLRCKKPFIDDNQLIYALPPIEAEFSVKASRLAYLNVDVSNVVLDDDLRSQGVEIQLQDHRSLVLNKTYRLEAQEQKGGALIGEIFTRSRLSNNRVLCWLRAYNFHQQSDGYLYIKDADEATFITNFNIQHKTEIQKISILTSQGQWVPTDKVYPGQVVDVKIEGEGLKNSELVFENIRSMGQDSLIGNNTVRYYRLSIPMDIKNRTIRIFENGEALGRGLSVVEYNSPAPLSFIQVKFGDQNLNLSAANNMVLYDQTIDDVILDLSAGQIDRLDQMHGIQYLDVRMEIRSSRNNLIDVKELESIQVCPGINSPRYAMYDHSNCSDSKISLNEELQKKTYDIDDWSKIYISISHRKGKYGGLGFEENMTIIHKKRVSFDIDVSFPAGLLTKRSGQEDFDNLGGISMAMISQFTFYHPDKIAIARPYKIGVGFIALNAFNFADTANPDIDVSRDIGLVVLGSLYPRSNSKLTFPLFLGGGYLLTEGEWFFMLGPGIRVSL